MEELNLLSFIAKTTLQIIIFDKATNKPVQYGSGCVAVFRGRPFLLTVDHVVRIRNQSTYAMVVTGLPPQNGLIPFLRIGGFMNFIAISLEGAETADPQKVTISSTEELDIAFAPVPEDVLLWKNKRLNYHGFEIPEGTRVFPILEEDAATLDKDDYYGFSGYINNDPMENIIRSEFVFKLNLTYQDTSKEGYLLFNE